MGLAGELDEVAARLTFVTSNAELAGLVDELVVAWSRTAGLLVRALREVDARGVAAAEGATSTAAWVRERERISPHTAALLARLATALDGSATGEALVDGQVNLEQASVIARAVAQVPAEHRADGERVLLRHAATFGPRELSRLGERLVEVVDPEGADAAEANRLAKAERRAYARRELYLTDVGDGLTRLTGWLDHESAAAVRVALDPLCNPRTAPDRVLDPRTAPQRRVDALVDICRLALSTGQLPDNGGDRSQVTITIDWEALRRQVSAAHLDDGSALSPAAARRMACDAGLLPAVLGGAGQPLDVGRERRLFTGPVRRAVLLRDRGCAFPSCDRPPRWTAIHHIRSWVDGGPTSLENAVAVCHHHHAVIHHSRWRVTINSGDGQPEFWPPPGLDVSGPLRNKYHLRR